jgi:predicted TIM-barrel enzyme
VKVIPVIHHLDPASTLEQARLAMRCGAFGVFLISHQGDNPELLGLVHPVREALRALAPHAVGEPWVGVNLLGESPVDAYRLAAQHGAAGVWMDSAGVSGSSADNQALNVAFLRRRGLPLEVFAGVAFKYRGVEPLPATAARNAAALGFVPTTSGPATGEAPSAEKVGFMAGAAGCPIAVASGLTADNLPLFRGAISHAIVSTGVSASFHRFDEAKLRRFVEVARSLSPNQP